MFSLAFSWFLHSAFHRHSHAEHKIRTELFKPTMGYTDAFNYVSQFYTNTNQADKARASESFKSGGLHFDRHRLPVPTIANIRVAKVD